MPLPKFLQNVKKHTYTLQFPAEIRSRGSEKPTTCIPVQTFKD